MTKKPGSKNHDEKARAKNSKPAAPQDQETAQAPADQHSGDAQQGDTVPLGAGAGKAVRPADDPAAKGAGGAAQAGDHADNPAAEPAPHQDGDGADEFADDDLAADGPENPWLDAEAARDHAVMTAALAAGELEGLENDDFEAMAAMLDGDPNLPVGALHNLLCQRRGAPLGQISQETHPSEFWGLTAFRAVYVALLPVARHEAQMAAAHGVVPQAPDPLIEQKQHLNRIRRRERLARGTPYERKLRARRKAEEKRLRAAKAAQTRAQNAAASKKD